MKPRQTNRLDLPGGEEPRRPLIGIALLPSAATLGNLLCGFVAAFFCLLAIRDTYFQMPPRVINPHLREFFPSYIAIGAYLVVAAMVFDALDGRLARMARRTSEFGAQLDSMADIVSFGAAPALLFVTLLLTLVVPVTGTPLVSKLQWRTGLTCALVFVSCAAIRLARYNAENVKDESAQRKFSGLPTPGAAAALVALILLHEDLRHNWEEITAAATLWTNVLRWIMAPVTFGLGLLMVSRLENVHVFNVYFGREHPPTHLIGLLVAAGVLLWSPPILLVIVAYGYVLSGLILNLRFWNRRRREATAVRDTTRAAAGNGGAGVVVQDETDD